MSDVMNVITGNGAASAQRASAANANNDLASSQSNALAQLAPYSSYGQQALIPLSQMLYGQNYNPSTQQFTGAVDPSTQYSAFTNSPGYQFQMNQGLSAIQRQAAATGTSLGGNTLREMQTYGQGLAGQSYQQYIQNLMSQAGMGQQAATNSAGIYSNIGSQMAGNAYAGGQGAVQQQSNLTNLLYSAAGMGVMGSMMGGGGGSSSSSMMGGGSNPAMTSMGNGMYNSGFADSAGSDALGTFALAG